MSLIKDVDLSTEVNKTFEYEEENYQQKVAEFKIPVSKNYIYKFHSLLSIK